MAEVTDAVADVAEGVAEASMTAAAVSRSMSGRDFGIGFVAGGTITGLITYRWARKHFETKFDKIAAEEIEGMRQHYRAQSDLVRKGRKPIPPVSKTPISKRVKPKPKLETIIEEHGYSPPPPGDPNIVSPPEVPLASRKAREARSPLEAAELAGTQRGEWDYAVEQANRTPDKPYVVHEDEFAESEFTGVTLTYYAEDDILCDEQDKPIDNKETLVGEDNLLKFGHGSDNPNLVYIRNEILSVDCEVIKVDKSYTESVLGFKHAWSPKTKRKFDDE